MEEEAEYLIISHLPGNGDPQPTARAVVAGYPYPATDGLCLRFRSFVQILNSQLKPEDSPL